MLNSKLEKFIYKRVAIFFCLTSIVILIFSTQRWFIFFGFLVGTIYSLVKFSFTSAIYSRIVAEKQNNHYAAALSILGFFVSQLVTLAILAMSIIFNLYFFAGITVGILHVPFILFVNSLTEGFGLTHNKFE